MTAINRNLCETISTDIYRYTYMYIVKVCWFHCSVVPEPLSLVKLPKDAGSCSKLRVTASTSLHWIAHVKMWANNVIACHEWETLICSEKLSTLPFCFLMASAHQWCGGTMFTERQLNVTSSRVSSSIQSIHFVKSSLQYGPSIVL